MQPSSAAPKLVPSPGLPAGNVVALPVGNVRSLSDRMGSLFPKRDHELEFLPAAVEILETPASPLGRATALAISAFAAIALLWACIGEVDIVAVAEGKIVPSGRTKVIQPFEIGVVKTIAVEEGQHVKQGDLLLELDSTQTGADRHNAARQLMETRLEVARLRSILGLEGGEVLDSPTPDLDQAAVLLARSYRTSQLAEQKEKLATLDQELAKTKAGMRATQTEIQKLNQTIPLVEQQLQAKQGLLDKGLAPRMQVLELQQRLVEMQRDRDVQADHVSEAKAAISSLKRQRAQAEEQFTQDRLKELTEAESKAAALEQEFKKADQRQTLQRLTAPVDGTVQQLALHTLGGVVQPAQALMAIVPDDSRIEVEAMLQNKDIGFVEDGMEAVIKLETFPFTRYGTIPGRVTTVSSDAIEQSQKSSSPDSGEGRGEGSAHGASLVYATRIALDQTTLNVDGKTVNLTPGMAATVEIKTGRRKLIEFVLSPLLKMAGEAGRER